MCRSRSIHDPDPEASAHYAILGLMRNITKYLKLPWPHGLTSDKEHVDSFVILLL